MKNIFNFLKIFVVGCIFMLFVLPFPMMFGFGGMTYAEGLTELLGTAMHNPVLFIFNPVTAIVALISLAVVSKNK